MPYICRGGGGRGKNTTLNFIKYISLFRQHLFVAQNLLFSVASQVDQDSTRKHPYASQEGLLEIPQRREGGGGGGLIYIKQKGKNEPKLEFPERVGGGIKTKCPFKVPIWIFSGTHF